MTKDELMPKFAAGERSCPICGSPLPAHQTWPGARYRFCGKPECRVHVIALGWGRYIRPNEHKCEGENCGHFVHEGRYTLKPRYLMCSPECWYARSVKGNLVLKCGCGCGEDVLRPSKRTTLTGLVFVSHKHSGRYFSEKHLNAYCGEFREIVDEYLNGFARLHYHDVPTVRKGIYPFFLFLSEQGLKSLEDVTPKTVSSYLEWAEKSGRKSAAHHLSVVSTFFAWMIAQCRRKAANPVVGLIHYEPMKHRLPRPYGKAELDLIWQLLKERGNPKLRLAAAIAEEAGLRNREICRLQVADVAMMEQRIFVGLPTKNSRERVAFFSHKTKQYCEEWMRERDPGCGHNLLIYNSQGNPYLGKTLADDFKRVVCKEFEGKKINDVGLDKWSIHRLRHTMASNLVSAGADAATVMAAGGWLSFECMSGYAQVEPGVARRGYEEAMLRAQQQKLSVPHTIALTPAELLRRAQVKSSKPEHDFESERCV